MGSAVPVSFPKALIGSLPFVGIFPSAFWLNKSDTTIWKSRLKHTDYMIELVDLFRQMSSIQARINVREMEQRLVPIEWEKELRDLTNQVERVKNEEIERENQVLQAGKAYSTYALTGLASSLLAIAITTALLALGILRPPYAISSYFLYTGAALFFPIMASVKPNAEKEVCEDRQRFAKLSTS